MKRLWKAAFLGLALALFAGCPEPGHRASSGADATVHGPVSPAPSPDAE